MRCINNKKGISTVISVVLLVGFVVIMGLVVTNWSTKLIKRNIEKGETKMGTNLDCMNVEIKLSSTGAGDKVLFVENNNMKEQKLGGFISRFETESKIFVDYKNQKNEIDAFGAGRLNYATAYERDEETLVGGYDPDDVKKIEVIPRIELESGEVVDCVKNSAIYSLE